MDNLSEEPIFKNHSEPSGDIVSGVWSEPALTSTPSKTEDSGVWGEPALIDAAAADSARSRHEARIAEMWASTGTLQRLLVFTALSVFSGCIAILCTFAKGAVGYTVLAVVLGAPVVEELSKAMGPLMVLEKRPWLFGSATSIVLIGVVSGLVFATVENLLYFFVYIPAGELTYGTFIWRMTACTALHVTGTVLSCIGLARAWRRAERAKAEFKAEIAAPWCIAAIVLHALYNTGALVFGVYSIAMGGK